MATWPSHCDCPRWLLFKIFNIQGVLSASMPLKRPMGTPQLGFCSAYHSPLASTHAYCENHKTRDVLTGTTRISSVLASTKTSKQLKHRR